MTVFGRKLKRLRQQRGYSQSELALRAGLHLMSVAKLEQGGRTPTWETVQALAFALAVSCEQLADKPKGPKSSKGRKRTSDTSGSSNSTKGRKGDTDS